MADSTTNFGTNEFNNANGLNPIIFSKKVALAYTKKSKILDLLTNDMWEGEIKNQGDRVRIVLPNLDGITIGDGDMCPTPGSIDPEALDLVIDKQKTFRFDMSDKQRAQTQFKNIEDGYANAVAQKIAVARAAEVERAIFEYAAGTAYAEDTALPTGTTVEQGYGYTVYNPTKHNLAGDLGDPDDGFFGTDTTPLDITPQNAYSFMLKVKMALLDSGAIADDGTYDFKPLDQEAQDMRAVFVCGTRLAAILLQAYQLAGRSTAAGDMVVQDGVVKRVAGLEVHIDRVLDTISTTVGATTGTKDTTTQADGKTRYYFTNLPFIAGTKNAITKASQISKVEKTRDPYCFNDIIKGMELYGFKILHPEALVRGVAKKYELKDINAAVPVVVEGTVTTNDTTPTA